MRRGICGMGLFGFGKKKESSKEYKYNMLFNSPIDNDRNQQIKTLALKRIGDAGVDVNDVKTTSFGEYGSRGDFTGQPGESISIECASTPTMESSSSYSAITVKSNLCSEEAIRQAFQEIRSEVYDMGYGFTEY